DEEAAEGLAAHIERRGLFAFFDVDELERLFARLALARRHGLELDASEPELTALALPELCLGARSTRDLKGRSLAGAILASLPHEARRRLDAIAPEHVSIPGRAR